MTLLDGYMRADMRFSDCYASLESSRRGVYLDYRHAYTRAMDVPSAMPI